MKNLPFQNNFPQHYRQKQNNFDINPFTDTIPNRPRLSRPATASSSKFFGERDGESSENSGIDLHNILHTGKTLDGGERKRRKRGPHTKRTTPAPRKPPQKRGKAFKGPRCGNGGPAEVVCADFRSHFFDCSACFF